MPDAQHAGDRMLSDASRVVRRWLRAHFGDDVRSLTPDELKPYDPLLYPRGWQVTVNFKDIPQKLNVLLPQTFPFGVPRVGLADNERYLVWPHVEHHGLLCLPVAPAMPTKPEDMMALAFSDACSLIERYQAGVDTEAFAQEFLSYWNWRANSKMPTVRSLLRPVGPSRVISVWKGPSFDVVAEDDQALRQWLEFGGYSELSRPPTLSKGLLIELDAPPLPADYPESVNKLRALVSKHASAERDAVEEMLGDIERRVVVFLARATTGLAMGPAFCAVSLDVPRPASFSGFRKSRPPPRTLQQAANVDRTVVSMRKVARMDAAWIHGRGADLNQQMLFGKTVTIIGCGALGSLVAMRLGMSGVGAFHLVDPQVMEPQNVGRHALGARGVGLFKSDALRDALKRQLPHLRAVHSYNCGWQSLDPGDLGIITQSDLILGTTGEWTAEGPLNLWHKHSVGLPPILYGWMEERACAGHALAIDAAGPGCLQCLLTADGIQIVREAKWDQETTLLPEPACAATFQPFGPIELGFTEGLIADACVDLLTKKVTIPFHRIYATSTERLRQEGGMWTSSHLEIRPNSFEGRILCDRGFKSRADCQVCGRGATL